MWKLLSRSVWVVALAWTAFVTAPARAADEPTAFIQTLGDNAIVILKNRDVGQKEREAKFDKLLSEDFDVTEIGRFVLGRYWRLATPEQQEKYLKVFRVYILAVYAHRFADYSGEKFVAAASQPTADGASVASQIVRPDGGPPINIVWKITKQDGGYKIHDVIVENLSMTVTERDEFSSIIERAGGGAAGIDALDAMLEQKTIANGG